MSEPKDDAKRAILARRAKFVAAAVAGIGAACSKTPSRSEPCLSTIYVPEDAEAPPQPCLSPTALPADAGTPEPPPMPCLSVRPPSTNPDARPMPCLSPLPPPKDAGGKRSREGNE